MVSAAKPEADDAMPAALGKVLRVADHEPAALAGHLAQLSRDGDRRAR